MAGPEAPLRVVVLSCGSLGARVAARLRDTPGVREVALVTAPYRQPRRSLAEKVRHVYRTGGWQGFAGVLAGKLRRLAGAANSAEEGGLEPPANVAHLRVPDFHAPECLTYLRSFGPDLGVIAGTYILREEVFGIPRLGSINLHSGKAPQYRGAAPAFWELYNGEPEVGITIHRVTAALDAGLILLQETFPLDPAPPGDPLAYVARFRDEVLEPNGIRLMAETVARIADGRVRESPQDPAQARTWRTPDAAAVRELRRRVRERRLAAAS